MRRTLGGILILIVVLGGLVFASAASAGSERFIIGGEHVSDATDAQGVIVIAAPDGCVQPVNDPEIGADGAIVGCGPYPDCMHEFHYHGELFGDGDPAPDGCGWGEAFPYQGQPPDVTNSAEAITHESDALETNNPASARRDTRQALADLADLRASIWYPKFAAQRQGTTSSDEALVVEARHLTAAAKRLFRKAAHAHGRHRRRLVKRAHHKVDRARDKTRQVFEHAIS